MKYKFTLIASACIVVLFVLAKGKPTGNLGDYGDISEGKDKIKYLNIGEKDFVFSDIAKRGKISLFIIAAHWCGPCKALKESLNEAYNRKIISTKDVDVYYCLVSKDSNDTQEVIEKRGGYRHLKYIDQLTEAFPTTYILTPTRNCYTTIKGANYSVIMKTIKEMIITKRNYFDSKKLVGDSDVTQEIKTDSLDDNDET